ncbi:hypothetical protein ACR6HW_12435 [Fusibacter sp. JL298sf-3]
MKINKKHLSLLLVSVLAIVLLIINLFIMAKNNQLDRSADFKDVINWEDYQSSFEYVVDNFQVDGLSVKASTKGGNVTAVNVYEGLNNRPFLTLDGEYNLKPTEEQLIIENPDQTIQITITLAFTSHFIGYDILAYPTNEGFAKLNEKLVKSSTTILGSYNNLIFNISQSSLSAYDPDLMDQSVNELVRLIEEYFDNKN